MSSGFGSGLGMVLALGLFAGSTAAADLPKTKALAAAMMAVKTPAEGATLTPAEVLANKAAFAKLDGFFDFDALTDAAIAAHKAKLTAKELSRFRGLFRSLLRAIGYPDSGAFLRRAKLTYRAGKGGDVVMETAIEEDDMETDVTFRWAAGKVVDILFDGDSLTQDYRNQFGRIIKKKGAAALLSLLDKKVKAVEKSRGKID